MKWIAVHSTSISAVCFENSTLYISFIEGATHDPKSVFYGLLSARSKGTYFLRFIRGKYSFKKLSKIK